MQSQIIRSVSFEFVWAGFSREAQSNRQREILIIKGETQSQV